jgi:hypothetical protein
VTVPADFVLLFVLLYVGAVAMMMAFWFLR